jgi:hypothetical protein
MKSTIWTPTLMWLAAACAALVLAVAGPSESNVMGRLPAPTVERLDQQRIAVPRGMKADRMLALVAYSKAHRAEIDSWIKGLHLDTDSTIAWFKMPVLNDPGDERERHAVERKLRAQHPGDVERARLVPIFTDRQAFIRAAGLSSPEHASVLVVDREGKVLARAEGRFDESKAQALRETLLSQNN